MTAVLEKPNHLKQANSVKRSSGNREISAHTIEPIGSLPRPQELATST